MPFEDSLEEFARKIGADAEHLAQRIDREFEFLFDRAGERWKSTMTAKGRGPLSLGTPKARSAELATRSGALGSSFYYRREPNGGASSSMVLGNFAPYAKVHELGTVGAGGSLPDIVPVNKKALTIPLEDALTPSGLPKEPSARAWPDTFLWFSEDDRNGSGYIVREDPNNEGELQFLYKLALRVAIPPRLGMRTTFEAQITDLDADLRAALERAIQG